MERNLIRFDAKGKGWQKLARWAGLVKKYPQLAEVVQVKSSLSDWKASSSLLLTRLTNTQVGIFCSFFPQVHCLTFYRIKTSPRSYAEYKALSKLSKMRDLRDR